MDAVCVGLLSLVLGATQMDTDFAAAEEVLSRFRPQKKDRLSALAADYDLVIDRRGSDFVLRLVAKNPTHATAVIEYKDDRLRVLPAEFAGAKALGTEEANALDKVLTANKRAWAATTQNGLLVKVDLTRGTRRGWLRLCAHEEMGWMSEVPKSARFMRNKDVVFLVLGSDEPLVIWLAPDHRSFAGAQLVQSGANNFRLVTNELILRVDAAIEKHTKSGGALYSRVAWRGLTKTAAKHEVRFWEDAGKITIGVGSSWTTIHRDDTVDPGPILD